MQRWGLIVEQTKGWGQNRWWRADVLEEFVGSREDALRRLQTVAEGFQPTHPMVELRRKRAYRIHDGFLVIYTGSMEDFPARFSVAEAIFDSGIMST